MKKIFAAVLTLGLLSVPSIASAQTTRLYQSQSGAYQPMHQNAHGWE